MVIYSIIPLLIIIGLLLLKKVNFKEIVNGIFWGIISVLLTIIVGKIILPIFGFSSSIINNDISLFAFFINFFIGALPEELSKLISIKFSSEKEKDSIYINSILVGMTFKCIENILYNDTFGASLSLIRVLHAGHLLYQILMALFLIKALNSNGIKKIIYNILAIALPVLCHNIYNTFNSIDIVSYVFYAIGILTYIFTLYIILKISYDNKEKKVRLFGLKLVVIILTILFIMIIHSQNNNSALNEIQNIQEDNIELKVLSSEKVEINDYFASGNYIKVKVELKNNNDVSYITDMYHFRIVDNLNKHNSYLSIYDFEDGLYEIDAGEKVIGYLYFEDEGYNYTYLIYTAGEFGNKQTYNFNIK